MKKAAFALFRRLPGSLRRAVIHLLTPSYTVGAVAVLRRTDGRVAFVDQRHSPGWALPGGLLARHEPAASALVRELSEELGLELDPSTLPVPHASVNARVRRVDVVYLLDVPDSTKLLGDDDAEVLRTGWFGLDALPELSEPTVDILRAVRLVS
ncbi:MAG: NUDIX domain-containing protein [Frankiales bacterium]|nr:NUDIX domain-containing protein [Frankiales bacterium]